MVPNADVEQDSLQDDTRIGDWRLYPSLHEVRRGGEEVRLEPKAVALLVRLAERAGRMVSREELLDWVWPGMVVGDDSLTQVVIQVVIKLRKALGDQPRHPAYIQTIPKQGYRLIAAYVTGSVQRTPGRLEAHIRLIDSGSGRQLWSERFDRRIGDLFDVQAEISRQMVRILEARLTQAEHWRLARRYTRQPGCLRVATARGDRETAEWEVEEIRALGPGFVPEAWLATYPMTDTGQVHRLAKALTSLGL